MIKENRNSKHENEKNAKKDICIQEKRRRENNIINAVKKHSKDSVIK